MTKFAVAIVAAAVGWAEAGRGRRSRYRSTRSPTRYPTAPRGFAGNSKHLKEFGISAHLHGKIGECKGDCDSDSQCARGLKCFQSNRPGTVTGCKGKSKSVYDYCYNPAKAKKTARPTAYPTAKPTASVNFTSEKLPFVTLTNSAGDTVKAYPFGACITSYVKGGKETLAMRADNKMDGSKPISGGIPHCFPQFGPGAMQQHGFARNCTWDVEAITDGPDEPSVVFLLKDTAYTRSMWDFAFEVRYTIELGSDSLDTTFSVLNKGDVPFQFTAALHSYWAVSTVPNITVSGPFKGASYLDKSVDPPVTRTGEANDLTISKATDSVYQDVWGDLKITDRRDASVLGIKASGWTDTVVWNPLKESMGSSKFVCVECAKAAQPVTVPPGAEWVAAMLVTPSISSD